MLSRLATSARPALRQRFAMPAAAQFHSAPTLRAAEEEAAVDAAPKESFLETIQHPMIMAPLFGLVAIGPIGNHMYHFDAETQLLGLFALFVGTVASQGGEAIGKMIDGETGAIIGEINAQEDAVIEQMELMMKKTEQFIQVQKDLGEVLAAQRGLVFDTLDARTLQMKHAYRNQYVAMLDAVLLAEERKADSVKVQLLASAESHVRKEVAKPAVRDATLKQALDVIEGKTVSTDIVGKLYADYFDQFSADLEKNANNALALTVDDDEIADGARNLATRFNFALTDAQIADAVRQVKENPLKVSDISNLLNAQGGNAAEE